MKKRNLQEKFYNFIELRYANGININAKYDSTEKSWTVIATNPNADIDDYQGVIYNEDNFQLHVLDMIDWNKIGTFKVQRRDEYEGMVPNEVCSEKK